jgi:hypothetical protein
MLEVRPSQHGLEWQYAFAPVTGFAINTFWKAKESWSMPARNNGPAWNPSNSFYVRRVAVEADK